MGEKRGWRPETSRRQSLVAERATEEGAGQADGARREERCLPGVHTQVLTAASTWGLT